MRPIIDGLRFATLPLYSLCLLNWQTFHNPTPALAGNFPSGLHWKKRFEFPVVITPDRVADKSEGYLRHVTYGMTTRGRCGR